MAEIKRMSFGPFEPDLGYASVGKWESEFIASSFVLLFLA